jgi:N-acetylmuramate 1-kinase
MPRMVESTGTSPPYDRRLDHAQRWLNKLYENVGFNWDPIAGDASNRRYFRVEVDGHSHVVMDAPPEHGSQAQFVDIARRLHAAGLHAPRIIRRNLTQGYLLLEDLGDALYRDLLNEDSVTDLFDQAFDALATMALEVDTDGLPDYGEALMYDEMYWFVDYYLNRHRNVTLDHAQRQSWTQLCDTVVASALAQPRVFVHRDVHSCNLLQTSENNLGIIDFQDAATGPLSYDFISLIWDRYIA